MYAKLSLLGIKLKFRELLKKGNDYFISNGKEESGAIFLLEHASNKTSPQLFAALDNEVSTDVVEKYESYLKEHVEKNKPIYYIIGHAPFYGYEFIVNENVLIPRFETEELVENVLMCYDEYFKGKPIKAADIATGSGCIGITLKLEQPNMDVSITDISEEALVVAKKNAEALGADVKILQGDMVQPVMDQKFDLIVSNPPYIPQDEEVQKIVKDNEPNIALFGGSDGLKFYRIIMRDAAKILNDNAILAFEHGFDKKNEMIELAKTYFPGAKIKSLKDLEGKDRMTIIIKGFENE